MGFFDVYNVFNTNSAQALLAAGFCLLGVVPSEAAAKSVLILAEGPILPWTILLVGVALVGQSLC